MKESAHLLRIQSSSNLYAKNSSSRFFRNWGLTRNDPTTPNSRTNPTGVHTKNKTQLTDWRESSKNINIFIEYLRWIFPLPLCGYSSVIRKLAILTQ